MTAVDIPPTAAGPRRWFVAARSVLDHVPMSLVQVAIRISIGSIFLNAGLLKVRSWEFAVKLFQDEYKLPLIDPEIGARLAAFNELVWPIFLFVGLATRIATLPLLAMDLVIVYVYPDAWNEQLLWAGALGLLLIRGPGAISLDFLIEKGFQGGGRTRPEGAGPAKRRV